VNNNKFWGPKQYVIATMPAPSPGLGQAMCFNPPNYLNVTSTTPAGSDTVIVSITTNLTGSVPIAECTTHLTVVANEIQIPVRVCAVAGSPAAGATNMDKLLLDRINLINYNSWGPGASITFHPAFPAGTANPHFPVIPDPNPSGTPGDIDIVANNMQEYKDVAAACSNAWKNTYGISQGLIIINANRVFDNGKQVGGFANGTVINCGSTSTLICKDQCPAWAFILDTQPAVVTDRSFEPGDPHDSLLGHELGHLLMLYHGNGLDDNNNGLFDDVCDKSESAGAPPVTIMTNTSPSADLIQPLRSNRARLWAKTVPGATLQSLTQPGDN
jgi:hypothetical protein